MNIWVERPLTGGIVQAVDLQGRILFQKSIPDSEGQRFIQFASPRSTNQIFFIRVKGNEWNEVRKVTVR